jgi:hypothetical protein
MQAPSAFGFLKIMGVKTKGYSFSPELPFISAQELLYDKCSWPAQLSICILHFEHASTGKEKQVYGFHN